MKGRGGGGGGMARGNKGQMKGCHPHPPQNDKHKASPRIKPKIVIYITFGKGNST